MRKIIFVTICLLMMGATAPAMAKTGSWLDCEADCPRENRPCVGCCTQQFMDKSVAYKTCNDNGEKCIENCGGWYVSSECTKQCMDRFGESCRNKPSITIDYTCPELYQAQ